LLNSRVNRKEEGKGFGFILKEVEEMIGREQVFCRKTSRKTF